MRVALCLHGHFRCFDQTWPSLKAHVIDLYQPDIFVMSWTDSMGIHLFPPSTQDPRNHPGFNLASPPVTSDYIKSVLDKLNPVDVHFDHYWLHDQRFQSMIEKYHEWHHPSIHHRPKGILSLNWIRYVNLMQKKHYEEKQGFVYDRVICTRWDIEHSLPVDLERLDPNLISTPNLHECDNLISEVWASSNSHLMDLWAEQINGIDELVAAGTFSFGPHEWLRAWFEYKNIPWEWRSDLGTWIRR